VWSDAQGRIWVSEWNAGQLGLYDPGTQQWREWKLPGRNPQAYAVYVDERDIVWVSDWGADVILAFDPRSERFTAHPMSEKGADVRQILYYQIDYTLQPDLPDDLGFLHVTFRRENPTTLKEDFVIAAEEIQAPGEGSYR